MYSGDTMSDSKPSAHDPYSDPSNSMPNENGGPKETNGGRGRSQSRSRSRSPMRNRSPRRSSPPSFRRRSPPPRRPNHAPTVSSAPTPSQVLGVFGLSIRTMERDLEDEFSRYGQVEKVTIVYDQRSGRSRGFGFIKMGSVPEATACIEKLNGVELNGRRIRVDYSITERPHNPTPGEYMGLRRSNDSHHGGRGSYDRYDRYDRGSSRYDRDSSYYRGDRERDRDRDYYGRDRDRDRDWRDRRSPAASRGGRYSPSPPPSRRRRSYSRSPPRGAGSSPKKEEHRDSDRGSRW
ncbi:hypothetical protein FRC03_012518 [Tulasnella sp. 419]|nr:hypothetical protein FRC02_012038 [Tulasnella sp. 418]KAG8966106.1 hypothetical protein FRC03_012518 [Tulasnella sp. 419]